MTDFSESVVEDAALEWLATLGYAVLHGRDIAAWEPGAERGDPNYRAVLLGRGLRNALLPKLISGKVEVRSAERFVGATS